MWEHDSGLRRQFLQELDDALIEEGLGSPTNRTDDMRRQGFEVGYLEGRLLSLSEEWEEGDIYPLDCQLQAWTLYNLIMEREG